MPNTLAFSPASIDRFWLYWFGGPTPHDDPHYRHVISAAVAGTPAVVGDIALALVGDVGTNWATFAATVADGAAFEIVIDQQYAPSFGWHDVTIRATAAGYDPANLVVPVNIVSAGPAPRRK